MKIFIFEIALCALLGVTQSEEIRLLNLDPPEAQQYIDQQDTSLKYAPKVASNVPAVRFLGNEPHNVNEDIYLANQYHGQDGLGGYLYGYGVPDIAKTERKKAGGDLRGAYNYIAGNGQEIKVEYWDDGTGFHQIDNVPKIQPQQIDDTPEVKAAKEEHARIWQEQAERNSRPIENPYDSHFNYAPQGQAQHQLLVNQYQQQKQQFPNPGQNVHYQGSQNPAGFGGQYQASQASSQYANAPTSSSQATANRPSAGNLGISGGQYAQKPGSQYGGSQFGTGQGAGGISSQPSGIAGASYPGSGSGQISSSQAPGLGVGSSQYGGNQASSSSQFGAGQGSGSGKFGAAQGSGSGQFGAGQASGQYGAGQASGSGKFGAAQGSGSGQFGAGQASGQYGAGQASGQYGAGQTSGQFGAGQASGQYGGSQASGQFGAGQASGQYGAGQASGSGKYGAGQTSGGQYGGISGGQATGHYGSQGSASSQYGQSYSGKNEGEYNEQENQEEQGPPKGFFYSFDYPVGIIVSKGGAANLKDLYSKNKDNFEKQLQDGHLPGSRSSTGYIAA